MLLVTMQDKPTLLRRNFQAVAYVGVVDDSDLEEAMELYEKPSYEFAQTAAIFIPSEQCIKLKLDFSGNSDSYGFYLTLFLYNDHKVLGKLHYVHEAMTAEETVSGHFKLSGESLRLFTTSELQKHDTELFCILITL